MQEICYAFLLIIKGFAFFHELKRVHVGFHGRHMRCYSCYVSFYSFYVGYFRLCVFYVATMWDVAAAMWAIIDAMCAITSFMWASEISNTKPTRRRQSRRRRIKAKN